MPKSSSSRGGSGTPIWQFAEWADKFVEIVAAKQRAASVEDDVWKLAAKFAGKQIQEHAVLELDGDEVLRIVTDIMGRRPYPQQAKGES